MLSLKYLSALSDDISSFPCPKRNRRQWLRLFFLAGGWGGGGGVGNKGQFDFSKNVTTHPLGK